MIPAFEGEYRFLSNFWTARVVLDGIAYPSVENAYQAAKTLEDRTLFECVSASEAKKFGKTVTLRPDWADVKYGIMLDLVRQKFAHEHLAELLRATGDQEIVEGNWWHDVYWGKCNCSKHAGLGNNMLGRILMKVREEIS